MPEVIVVCEGQSEREFCRKTIAPALALRGIELAGTLAGKAHRKRGGIQPWKTYRADVIRLSKERDGRHVAILVDYYAMPQDWPGRTPAKKLAAENRGKAVEEALVADLPELAGRFHPCVQLHEFEALLYVEPEVSAPWIALGAGSPSPESLVTAMTKIRGECGGLVERINDRSTHAPSKRLIRLVAGYDKAAWGVTAAMEAGLARLRSGCPWLERWMSRLEKLGQP